MSAGVVGKAIARVDGRAKVTGAARYAADTEVTGVAHGVLVMSAVARGRIVELNIRTARAAPGVVDVYTHLTMPRLTVPAPTTGYFKRFVPMQDENIQHAGQPVAIVVARTLVRGAIPREHNGFKIPLVQRALADVLDGFGGRR